MSDLNTLSSKYIVARYGQRWRVTANPQARQEGRNNWIAGPVSDWCEVASLSGLESPRTPGKASEDKSYAGHRIDRQRALHKDLKGLCLRRGGHWPRSERD